MSRKENDITKTINSEEYKGYEITFVYDYDNIKVRIFKIKRNYSQYGPSSLYFMRVQTKKEGLKLAKIYINYIIQHKETSEQEIYDYMKKFKTYY